MSAGCARATRSKNLNFLGRARLSDDERISCKTNFHLDPAADRDKTRKKKPAFRVLPLEFRRVNIVESLVGEVRRGRPETRVRFPRFDVRAYARVAYVAFSKYVS